MKGLRTVLVFGLLALGAFWLWGGKHKEGESTNLKFGLDLEGGAQLLFEAQPTQDVKIIDSKVMMGVQKVIENRVNGTGTSEAVVQTEGKNRLVVEIPGEDPDSVKKTLLRTAKLEFKELDKDMVTWVATGITGADLKRAQATPDVSGTNWQIAFEMKPDGAKKFSALTGRLLKGELRDGTQATIKDETGKAIAPRTNLPLAIFLDDQLLSSPQVNGQISESGQITGNFSREEAMELAVQLNAGALPVPLKSLTERKVSPTLGQESLLKSYHAALIGLALIAGYLIIIYRMPGFLASVALLGYIIISLGVFTRFVTLSSAGIAGFILSIGMATDANILIFERIKEELRNGKGLYKAVEEGFQRAFPSIFDSNLNTLIVCLILGVFGTNLIRGFAVTLALGVIVSFISAIFMTREFINWTLNIPFLQKPSLYGVDNKTK